MNKAIAEFICTLALVLIGCGAAIIGGLGSGATAIDLLGIAAGFGLTIVAMAYGIGQISGCHINPAVSFGVWTAGRMSTSDLVTYVIAQVLYLILSGKASGWTGSLGQNGWGPAISASTMSPPVLGLHSRRHAARRAGRHCWACDWPDSDRHPPARHQHHRYLRQSGALV